MLRWRACARCGVRRGIDGRGLVVETGVTRVVVQEAGARAAPPKKRLRQAQADSARDRSGAGAERLGRWGHG